MEYQDELMSNSMDIVSAMAKIVARLTAFKCKENIGIEFTPPQHHYHNHFIHTVIFGVCFAQPRLKVQLE